MTETDDRPADAALATRGYWEWVEMVRDAHFCENRIQVTPGIGDPRVVGWVACGHCSPCQRRGVAERCERLGRLSPPEPLLTNYRRALVIVEALYDVRGVIRELKSAFASRGELDGGVKAVLDHPLYLEAMAEQNRLHDELMVLI